MDVRLVIAFWLVSMLFVVTPGADWAYAIGAGLTYRRVWPAVVGMLAGHGAATVAVAAGVGAVLAGMPVLMGVLTAAGAGYLVWLGMSAVRFPAAPPAVVRGPVAGSAARQVLKGFGVSGLNPKMFLLLLALMPQFTDRHGSWPVAVQMLLLGAVHVGNCGVVYTAVGCGARIVLGARPAAARFVGRFSGVAMVGIGSTLLVEQLVH